MQIEIIGVPVFYGCDIQGVETAPAKLREMGLARILESEGHTVTDGDDIAVTAAGADEKYASHAKMKYVGPVYDMCAELSQKVSGVLRKGAFPLIIGGDHSDGIGIVSGVSRVFGPDTAVMWIDSHSDIHCFDTSPSGNIHGVPLGVSVGMKCGPFNAIFGDAPHIKGENIFIIGLRSYEPEEEEIMSHYGVNRYSVEDVRRMGADGVMDDVKRKLDGNGVKALHVSFDIDSLDPSIAPGTGIREPDGLTEQEAAGIVHRVFATGMVHSMDISELNPLRDKDDMTSQLALRIAACIR